MGDHPLAGLSTSESMRTALGPPNALLGEVMRGWLVRTNRFRLVGMYALLSVLSILSTCCAGAPLSRPSWWNENAPMAPTETWRFSRS